MTSYKEEIKKILKSRGLESDFYNVWLELVDELPDSEVEGVLSALRDYSKGELENYTKTLYNKKNAKDQGDIGGWNKVFKYSGRRHQ